MQPVARAGVAEQSTAHGPTSMSVLLTRRSRETGASSRAPETRAKVPSSSTAPSVDKKGPPPALTEAAKAPERPTASVRASSTKARALSAKPQAPAGALVEQELGTPDPPPLSQIPKRPVRATRSQAPPEEPVEEDKPKAPKKTRTATHPRANSKKIVARLQKEWASRIASLPGFLPRRRASTSSERRPGELSSC